MPLRVAALLLVASLASAQDLADAPAKDTPVAAILLEAANGTPQAQRFSLRSLVETLDAAGRASAREKLAALDRATLSADSIAALDAANALLKEAAPPTAGANASPLVRSAASKLAEGDYEGATALAQQALKENKNDKDALAVLYSAKDRVRRTNSEAPSRGGENPAGGSVQTTTQVQDDRPLKLAVKVKGPNAPPDLVSADDSPESRKRSPWLPYAMAFGTGLIGVGIWLKNARDKASAAIDEGTESVLKTGDNVVQRGKDFVNENPKTSIAIVAVPTILMGAIVLPSMLGIGGGMTALTTAGTLAPAAATSATVATAAKGAVIGGAAAVLMSGHGGGDSGQATEKPAADSDKPEQITDDQWTRIKKILNRIKNGEPLDFPAKDGTIYRNGGPGKLPAKPDPQYYREYTVAREAGKRGVERLVIGKEGEVYFSPDHYYTFIRLPWPL